MQKEFSGQSTSPSAHLSKSVDDFQHYYLEQIQHIFGERTRVQIKFQQFYVSLRNSDKIREALINTASRL